MLVRVCVLVCEVFCILTNICGISITVQPDCEYLKDYWQSILLIKLLLFLETLYTTVLFIAVSFPHSQR